MTLATISKLFIWSWVCAQSCSTLWPHRLQPTRLLCSRDFPGKNTGVGCHFLLQGVFPTQGSNSLFLHLLYWQVDFLPLRHLGSQHLIFYTRWHLKYIASYKWQHVIPSENHSSKFTWNEEYLILRSNQEKWEVPTKFSKCICPACFLHQQRTNWQQNYFICVIKNSEYKLKWK